MIRLVRQVPADGLPTPTKSSPPAFRSGSRAPLDLLPRRRPKPAGRTHAGRGRTAGCTNSPMTAVRRRAAVSRACCPFRRVTAAPRRLRRSGRGSRLAGRSRRCGDRDGLACSGEPRPTTLRRLGSRGAGWRGKPKKTTPWNDATGRRLPTRTEPRDRGACSLVAIARREWRASLGTAPVRTATRLLRSGQLTGLRWQIARQAFAGRRPRESPALPRRGPQCDGRRPGLPTLPPRRRDRPIGGGSAALPPDVHHRERGARPNRREAPPLANRRTIRQQGAGHRLRRPLVPA